MSKVIIFQQDQYDQKEIDESVDKIIKEIYRRPLTNIQNIMIKPNMMYYWDASTGETTDPKIVSSIIDSLRKRISKDTDISIVESDASAMKTKYAFKVLGYNKLCEKKGVGLVNLSNGEMVKKKVQLNRGIVELKINKKLLYADLIINVPKLKVHRNPPVISCALKNFFGLISTRYKFQYHPKIDIYVSAINKLIKTKLILVDGLVVHGKITKKMGLLIGANDPVSCDMVVSKIAGRNPIRDKIISNAILEGIGDPNYELLDPHSTLEIAKAQFPKLNPFRTNISWLMQLKMLKIYAQFTGDILPPVLIEK